MSPVTFAINCSLALREVPLVHKAARARELGYQAVEFWWPFASDSPEREEVRSFVDAVQGAEVETVLLNFPGGGPSVGDRGLLAVPGREDDFFRCARVALDIGRHLGATRFNPMAGNVARPWSPDAEEFRTAVANLARISAPVADAGAVIVLEPLSGFPEAALTRYAEALELATAARDAGAENVAVLFDLYHAAVNGDEILSSLDVDPELIGHVQIADAPGRGWPGTGGLPIAEWLRVLVGSGYRGHVGLECTGDPVPEADLRAALAPAPR